MDHPLTDLLIAAALLSPVMAVLWWRQLQTADATSVDVAWAAAIGVIGLGIAASGTGSSSQRGLAALLAGAWSGRLTWHLLIDRVLAGHGEDGRYRHLRAHWGERAGRGFFWVYQAQAAFAVVFALPFALLAHHGAAELSAIQWSGTALAAAGATLTTVADRQLRRHRRDPAAAGRTCRRGTWSWCRHPNYLGEWLTWCGFALAASPAPTGMVAWSVPALLFVLIHRVSGIPFTEQQALRSRGDDYRRYQQEVPAFFPWPRPRPDA